MTHLRGLISRIPGLPQSHKVAWSLPPTIHPHTQFSPFEEKAAGKSETGTHEAEQERSRALRPTAQDSECRKKTAGRGQEGKERCIHVHKYWGARQQK